MAQAATASVPQGTTTAAQAALAQASVSNKTEGRLKRFMFISVCVLQNKTCLWRNLIPVCGRLICIHCEQL